jgi:fructose-specific component phosphotransferase system IIB-like protein
MTRSRLALLLILVVAVPAAAAAGGSFFSAAPQPCFTAGAIAYRLSGGANATYTIRVVNDAAQADLRLQLVDEPDAADFVLVDDSDNADACRDVGAIKTIRVDAASAKPDLTVTVSKQPAKGGHKIYVRSAHFSKQDAAALFAAIWKDTPRREALARR